MPTYHISVLKHQQRKDKKYPVSIRITNNRTSAYIKTNYYVTPAQLNKNFEVKDKFMLKMFLEKIEECEEKVMRRYGNDISMIPAKEIAEFLNAKPVESKDIDFISFAKGHIQKLNEAGRTKRAKHIQTTINALVDFLGKSLNAQSITSRMLSQFESFLRSERDIVRIDQFGKEVKTHRKPLTDTGVHDYMADIRCVFNEMLDKYNDEESGVVAITNYPFRKYKISRVNAPVKKNIGIESVRKIMLLPDSGTRQDLARDVFMLSFYLIGMNTVDLYNIPRSAYKNGRITYQRSKTKDRRQDNAEISIKVEPEMIPLIEKYISDDRLFVFSKMYRDTTNFTHAISNGLEKISKIIGEEKITAYWARHSWATIARNVLDVSIDDIALCLNHVSNEHKVTNIYIEKDFSKIDNANRAMIDLLHDAARS